MVAYDLSGLVEKVSKLAKAGWLTATRPEKSTLMRSLTM